MAQILRKLSQNLIELLNDKDDSLKFNKEKSFTEHSNVLKFRSSYNNYQTLTKIRDIYYHIPYVVDIPHTHMNTLLEILLKISNHDISVFQMIINIIAHGLTNYQFHIKDVLTKDFEINN
ncbi:hypothetical protein Glove_165g17 [Diversispora epigaea]|uniref:Uncharacterized protein n=1 Tax=Diversispora epigaea TaxID=1348612 RepID=A0A397IQZ5_9GLOM|nr:hypothetical protein Glove_165g17 [Diversispora epigaea]